MTRTPSPLKRSRKSCGADRGDDVAHMGAHGSEIGAKARGS